MYQCNTLHQYLEKVQVLKKRTLKDTLDEVTAVSQMVWISQCIFQTI